MSATEPLSNLRARGLEVIAHADEIGDGHYTYNMRDVIRVPFAPDGDPERDGEQQGG